MQTPGSPIPTPALEASHTFSVGTVLSRGFSVWISNLPLFLGISLVCNLPLLLVASWSANQPREPMRMLAAIGVTAFVQTVITTIVSGAVIRGVFEQLRGSRAGFGDSLRVAVRSFWRMIATSFGAGIIVMLFSLLLIVPGIMKACSYFVAVPVTVVEGTGMSDSLARSKALTDGYRWHLFGAFLVMWLLIFVLAGVLGIAAQGASPKVALVLNNLLPNAIVGSLTAVFYGVAYYQLRVAKEGIDIEQLAAVFD